MNTKRYEIAIAALEKIADADPLTLPDGRFDTRLQTIAIKALVKVGVIGNNGKRAAGKAC